MLTVGMPIRRCTECNSFLRNAPDTTEYDDGIEHEYDEGERVYSWGWRSETDVRICRVCGWKNLEISETA